MLKLQRASDYNLGIFRQLSFAETQALTFITVIPKRVEEGHSQVDEHSQVEGDAPPQGDLPGEPEQGGVVQEARSTQMRVVSIAAVRTSPAKRTVCAREPSQK